MILINNSSGEDYIEVVKLLMSINSIVDILYYSTVRPFEFFIYIVFLYV